MEVIPLPSHRNPIPKDSTRSEQPAGRAGLGGELQNSGIFIHRLQSWAHSAALRRLTAAELSQLYFSLQSVFYGQQLTPDWGIKRFLHLPSNCFSLVLAGVLFTHSRVPLWTPYVDFIAASAARGKNVLKIEITELWGKYSWAAHPLSVTKEHPGIHCFTSLQIKPQL